MRVQRIIIVTSLMGFLAPSWAADIHVDNANGVDGNDGLSATTQTVLTGPVRTLRRATQLARAGDRIVLNGHGQPFYEPLCLVGGLHQGFATRPFTIVGNGATISGLRDLPADGWQEQGRGLWRLSLTRKGHYRFLRGDQSIPEFVPETVNASFDDLPLDHYFSRRGAVYFRFAEQDTPYTRAWTYAAEEIGVSLVSVRDVRIENLRIVGFRVDGVNLDGNCRGVTLENVVIENNGRAGVSANGTSRVSINNSQIAGNGRHSVLITESALVNIENSDLGGVEPTVVE